MSNLTVTESRYLRLVRASAAYDLIVTLPFATPWSAGWLLDKLGGLHAAAGLPGAAPPPFAPQHLFFVSLFGTVVVLWSILRLRVTRTEHGLYDGIGRALFSLWMIIALVGGASALIGGMLVIEASFGVAQLAGYAALTRSSSCASARSPAASASRS